MKDIKSLVNNFNKQPLQTNSNHDLQNGINPIVKELVDQVFKQLEIIFPGWKYALPDENRINLAKREWVKAFYENNIDSVDLVKCGLVKSRKSDSDFLPSCGKFISWCKPSPEDMGWPSHHDAMQQCIKHRVNQNMFSPDNIYTRPMIIELCKTVDWFYINSKPSKEADKHFADKYMELLQSGYVEPVANSEHERLPTQETVNENLSDEQKEDKRLRGLDAIREIKAKFKNRGK